MAISWPGGLPQAPMVNGFSLKKRTNRVETPTADGYTRTRQRFTGKVYDVTVTLPPMSATQLALFNVFYDSTSEDGTIEFGWFDFSQNPPAAQNFRFGTSTPNQVAVRGPGASDDSYWTVSFPLEMRK